MVPVLGGCRSQGDTLQWAQHDVTKAIELDLETPLSHWPGETGSHQGKVTVPVPLPS